MYCHLTVINVTGAACAHNGKNNEPMGFELMKSHFFAALACAVLLPAGFGLAETIDLAPTEVTEWKAVYGTVQARDVVPARARIGGVIEELSVTEGDLVEAGQRIGLIIDEKIAFQIAALDAQLAAYGSQLRTAQTELERAETLLKQGVVTKQRLDQLSTATDVVRNQIASTEANRAVIVQQQSEGDVLAPVTGRVLMVPASRGAVIMPGEPIANIGGGGFFLRLALPERFSTALEEGSDIRIATSGGAKTGKLAKIYPQISGGRVTADVEVEALDTEFVDARILVEVPIGKRHALIVPQAAVSSRNGLDFVSVSGPDGPIERVVVVGRPIRTDDDAEMIEIMSGLEAGDKVMAQ